MRRKKSDTGDDPISGKTLPCPCPSVSWDWDEIAIAPDSILVICVLINRTFESRSPP